MKYFRMLPLIFFITAVLLSGSNAQDAGSRPAVDIDSSADDEMISISVHNIDINDFMRGLAKKRKINIITSKDVSGKISVNLYDIPLPEALESICLANGYQLREKNNIYFIVKEEKEGKAGSVIGSTVKSFKINFSDIAEVRKVVEDVVGEGRVTIHQGAKILIVEDSPENIRKVEKIIKDVDSPPRQVLIEAKILEITLGDNFSFGVDWRKMFVQGLSTGDVSTENFSLPSDAEGAQGFFFEVIRNTDSGSLQVLLDALRVQTDVNVLATPKLLALDGRSAEIIIGGRLGYYLVTTTETSTMQSVEFLDIGTQLKLTPHISEGGEILMEIHPEVSEGTVDALGLPSTRTTEVSTSLIAGHGDTILIGGLIRQSKEITNKRIPLLGSIPLIGPFFGRNETKETKTEIIVLITPYLISPELRDIYEKKIDIVERAEESHQEKQTAVKKIFGSGNMFEKIQGQEKNTSVENDARREPSPLREEGAGK